MALLNAHSQPPRQGAQLSICPKIEHFLNEVNAFRTGRNFAQEIVKMSTKHTPGPWRAQTFFRAIAIQSCKPTNLGDLPEIGEIPFASSVLSDSEQEANARLIAAAPEMLEALSELFAASPHDMSDMLEAFRARQKHNPAVRAHDLCDKFGDALCKAQSAIAKATGTLTPEQENEMRVHVKHEASQVGDD